MIPLEREATSIPEAKRIADAMRVLGADHVRIRVHGFWEYADGRMSAIAWGPLEVVELHRTCATVWLKGREVKVRPSPDPHDASFLSLRGERR